MGLQNIQKKVKSILQKCYFYIEQKTSNKKQKIMCTFSQDQIKDLVKNAATIQCTVNGSTTTLEVKNAIHLVAPGCGLKQVEVSDAMKTLYDEGVLFDRENQSTGGNYFIYSLKVAAPVAAPTTSTPAASQTSLVAIASTGTKSAVVGSLGQHPVDFLKRLDPKLRVAYSAGNSDYVLTDTTDWGKARKLFKDTTGTKHNDVRSITLKTYFKRMGV